MISSRSSLALFSSPSRSARHRRTFFIVSLSILCILRCGDANPDPDPDPDPDPLADPAPITLPEAQPFLGAGANPNLLSSLVKRLPKKGDKKEILISYLAAVPTISGGIDQYLFNISASLQNSAQSSSKDRDSFSRKLNQIVHCLSTDGYVSVVSGALVAAIVEINNDPTILPDYQLKYVFGNTCGNDSHSTRLFMEHWQAGARVFIGPEKNCKTEAAMAASQNLPMISYRCNDQEISRDNYRYRTFARTVPPSGEIFKAFLALMKDNNWRKFSVIYDVKKGHSMNELFETLKRVMEEENRHEEKRFEIMNVSRLQFVKMDISSQQDINSVKEALRNTMDTTRIYLTFDNVRLFRALLSIMGEMGLTEKDYMLIYVDTSYDWLNVYHAMNNHFIRNTMTYLHQSWDANNSSDRKMLDYARSALSIIPTPVKLTSQKFNKFWKKAGEYIHYFGVQKTDNLKLQGNRIACYLYDAVYLYAKAVHELIEKYGFDENYDPSADGKSIIDQIVNRKYRSIQGFDMRIDERGNSKGNFSLLSWQKVIPVMNKSEPSYYPLDRALDITAIFIEAPGKERLPTLSFKNKRIHWKSGDGPPPDEPNCGFYGEKCEKAEHFTAVTLSILIFIMVFSFVLTGFTYRSRKYEKELSMIWRIEPNEVHRLIGGNESTASLLAADTDNTFNDVNEAPWFNEADMKGSGMRGVASYKGTLVALKEIVYYRKPKDLTRNAKKELRVMRQLAHPNVNNFMGIIICPTSICAVREFCSKGSLLDILRNSDMKLDHLYIASFVEDLVKGMIYIHDSELRVHGNLKSTNCLITSRWALQIADYGLHEVREGMHWDERPAMWENFLWTAPEAMAIPGTHVTRSTPTQKADVYSFGIILHEIFTREGPYSLCIERADVNGLLLNTNNNTWSDRMYKDEQFEKIVRRVYNDPNFRPSLKYVDAQNYVKDVMQACWNVDPSQRPDFKSGIRNKLKPLFTQIYKRNIMDHMIVMMEKYQTQLEDLVEERTTELRDEQKKSQNLLQRMLPISVAEQLLAGQDVVPEAFPPVTIYFSDIVGFTRISGESTPMEVVAFLNKLYTLFDSIIRRYDVYKVETIGDAYMVVSGVPHYKTMEFHAEQIAMMALHILTAVRTFEIPHRPNEQLMIRIGMHTGPCVAGVVGKTMPRYTLFGDTVNTASRMESNGEALRIHCSSSTQKVLSQISGFVLEERGTMAIKGKGQMTTYWLNGRNGFDFNEEKNFDPKINETRPDIFSRPNKLRVDRGSNWGINRDSSLSLATEKNGIGFMKRITDRSRIADSVFYNSANGGFASIGANSRELPKLSEDEKEGGTPRSNVERKKSAAATRNNGFVSSRNCSSTISNTSTSRQAGSTDYETMAMRKRSTSLPDGEKLNIDFAQTGNVSVGDMGGTSQSIPNYCNGHLSLANRTDRKTGEGSSPSISPSHSQYPSFRDLTTPTQRKRGIATLYPIRKRSLSCGDAMPATTSLAENAVSCAIPISIALNKSQDGEGCSSLDKSFMSFNQIVDDNEKELSGMEGLIGDRSNVDINSDGLRSCPQHRRKNKRSFLRDPSPLARRIREASPFAKKQFWSSKTDNRPSRADSLSRMFRKWRGGNEYEDLNDNDLDDDETFCEENGYEMSQKNDELTTNDDANRAASCSPTKNAYDSIDNSEPLLMMSNFDSSTPSTSSKLTII